MSKWHGGKGSTPRPMDDRKRYEDNWDRIFGRKDSDEVYDQTTGSIHENGLKKSSQDDEDNLK